MSLTAQSLTAHFQLMADYNQWMNQNIHQAAAQLSTEQLKQERGAFFGSILGTLNHLLVGDTLWLQRFADHPSNPASLAEVRQLPKPQGLDAMLYSELDALTRARVAMDTVILAFTQELTDDTLQTQLAYRNSKGMAFNKPFGHLVQHLFNHQTHHRGQVSTLLSQAGIDIGATDLLLRIADSQPQ